MIKQGALFQAYTPVPVVNARNTKQDRDGLERQGKSGECRYLHLFRDIQKSPVESKRASRKTAFLIRRCANAHRL